MIQDMGNDPASVARIVAELDKAASRPGVRSSSRVKTLFPRESTPKDIGPSPEVTPHDQTSIADARSSNLTANQWKSVRNLINDMRIPPRAQPSNIPPPPIGNLDHLTIEELQAARTMIQDMGNDPASVARVVAELDKAASRPGVRSSSKVTTLFPRESGRTNTGPPPGVTLQDLTSTDYPLATGDRRSTNLTLPTAEVPDDADDEDEDEDESPTSQEEQFLASRRKEKPAKPANKKTVGSTERKYGSPFGRRIGQALRTCLIIVAILYTAWYTVQGVSYLLTRGSSVQNDVFPQDNTPWINWSAITGGIGRMIPSGFGSSTGAGNKSSDLQTTIEDLDQKLPDKVHVEKDKKGILKIPQEFWHALRDLARGDDAKRSLEDAQKYIPGMTEAEWIDFRSGMRGALPKDGGLSVVEKECCVKAWNNWLQQNKDKIDKTMGGATLSKEEFVNLFNQEIKTYQQDIQRELAAQETRIKELADTVEQLCKPPVDEEQDAVTEKSVRSICDDIVKRAISAAKLDAVATGRIRGHATDVLANQVNFFGVGSGAVIDPQYNSLPWRFPKDYFPFRSKKWHQRDGYVPQPALSALSPWSEEGECFCAGPSVTGMIVNTNTIHVLTSRHIVPQHLVIEHILPGSTLDPGSRPKDIEVWMKFEEVTLRSEASAFSAKQFPETPKEKTLNEAWVKVGHFTFQDRNSGDTFQVFKLSDELGRMSASSNGFVIRAVSNYGADHTCFYRLRLYGEVDQSVKEWIDEEGDEK
ncbi:hypothetical protein GGR54DRAFT_601592 [Hypoxylon sp. NC1633]|nr:hypothetical protein GGR54DRAFT_601592 [Hypoxylon sp. NC1633]